MTAFTQNPDDPFKTDLEAIVGGSDIPKTQSVGYYPPTIAYLKPRERAYDTVDAAGNVVGKFIARRSIKVFIQSRNIAARQNGDVTLNNSVSDGILNPIGGIDTPTREIRYTVRIIDPSNFIPLTRDGTSINTTIETLSVTHDDLIPDLGMVFAPAALTINPDQTAIDAAMGAVDTLTAPININPSSILDNATKTGVKGFMSPENNSIVRSFENNKGRGLAGVIKQLSFNWIDFNWETDWGARAPMGTKVTISFECIHDLPPGLDASGYMRAPTHNVGSVMNTISGDPYDDAGASSRAAFTRAGASNVIKR
jgi:hypothetical protein